METHPDEVARKKLLEESRITSSLPGNTKPWNGHPVAVKKLGTIGVTVEIMRQGTKLPHEIVIYSEEELRQRESTEQPPEEEVEVEANAEGTE